MNKMTPGMADHMTGRAVRPGGGMGGGIGGMGFEDSPSIDDMPNPYPSPYPNPHLTSGMKPRPNFPSPGRRKPGGMEMEPTLWHAWGPGGRGAMMPARGPRTAPQRRPKFGSDNLDFSRRPRRCDDGERRAGKHPHSHFYHPHIRTNTCLGEDDIDDDSPPMGQTRRASPPRRNTVRNSDRGWQPYVETDDDEDAYM
jgi:hypothetical protein